MSNEKKLAITSDIVFSLDTKVKGKDYVYEVEHLHRVMWLLYRKDYVDSYVPLYIKNLI